MYDVIQLNFNPLWTGVLKGSTGPGEGAESITLKIFRNRCFFVFLVFFIFIQYKFTHFTKLNTFTKITNMIKTIQ